MDTPLAVLPNRYDGEFRVHVNASSRLIWVEWITRSGGEEIAIPAEDAPALLAAISQALATLLPSCIANTVETCR